MDEQSHLDFLTAYGQESCGVLSAVVGWESMTPQDAFEVFLRVFRQHPTPQSLSLLTDREVEQLRSGSERYFECDGITTEHIRTAIDRTLARYPDESR